MSDPAGLVPGFTRALGTKNPPEPRAAIAGLVAALRGGILAMALASASAQAEPELFHRPTQGGTITIQVERDQVTGRWFYPADGRPRVPVKAPDSPEMTATLSVELRLPPAGSPPGAAPRFWLLKESFAQQIYAFQGDRWPGLGSHALPAPVVPGRLPPLPPGLGWRDVLGAVAADDQTYLKKVVEKIRYKVARGLTFDTSGRARTGGLEAGSYWVFGFRKGGATCYGWDVPLELRPGSNSLVLDPANSAAQE